MPGGVRCPVFRCNLEFVLGLRSPASSRSFLPKEIQQELAELRSYGKTIECDANHAVGAAQLEELKNSNAKSAEIESGFMLHTSIITRQHECSRMSRR
jgi:hypothetical protein